MFEAPTVIEGPSFGFVITNADGIEIGGFGLGLSPEHELGDSIPAGGDVRVRAKLDNRFAPGRYAIQCWVHRNHSSPSR